ncbi:DUF4913 domain-containing protein [Nocardia sp. NPDC051570]|uniref:DUF4913 domain-containing protein n=1 Tax=Nocardia sp. NPDC051570 TaxID=3364324 RepID=UPI0037B70F71
MPSTSTGGVDHGAAPEWRYRSLGQFLQRYLAPTYRRQVTDRSDTVWCPQPWLHKEAAERLAAIWRAYEHGLRSPNPKAENDWWLTCADPTLRALMKPDGPFQYCSVRKGHSDMLVPLPMQFAAAPPELFLEVVTQPSAVPDAAA